MNRPNRIFVVFPTSGLDHRGAWDAASMQDAVLSNEQILAEIEQRCSGIEFVGKTAVRACRPICRLTNPLP